MPSEADPMKCSGCGTCAEKCPENAIDMIEGLPKVNAELCIECGICVITCPQQARDILQMVKMIT